MVVKVQKFGNSKGVILPKKIMELCAIDDEVSINVEDGHIVIAAVHKPRKNWEQLFQAALEKGDTPESDFSNGIGNDFDENEWTW